MESYKAKYHLWKWRFDQTSLMKFLYMINLTASKFIFKWYYKRVPLHFHSWPFFKSVNLLIQNYVHSNSQYNSNEKHLGELIRENTRLHNKINKMELQQMMTDGQIDFVNKNFGLDINKPSDN